MPIPSGDIHTYPTVPKCAYFLQGWFSMSKARYSMGNKQVSALQYASRIEPLVRVNARWGSYIHFIQVSVTVHLAKLFIYWTFFYSFFDTEHWRVARQSSAQKEWCKQLEKVQGLWRILGPKRKVSQPTMLNVVKGVQNVGHHKKA